MSSKEIANLVKKLNININDYPIKYLKKGIKIELEHGKKYHQTNITNDNLEITLKIVLAHIIEFPDYYTRLEEMEQKAKYHWRGKKKPNVFII